MRKLLLLVAALAGPAGAAGVVRIDAHGVIHPVTAEIVAAGIAQARQENADAILLQLNTPGGLMEATREVAQQMAASPIPVVTWVAPNGARAASAGFFLLLAGHVAAMAPGTRTGAASPVLLGQEMDPIMRKKVDSDASAWIRSLAAERGRDGKLAEGAVLEAKSFTAQEALAGKLIDLIAANEKELFEKLDGREIVLQGGTRRVLRLTGSVIRDYEPTLRQKIIQTVADPNIAFLLLIAGVLGLYLEFTTPGAILPGVVGALLLLFGLSALSVLPISWLGVALLLLALALFTAEAFVTSHGVLGIGGGVAMVLGALLLVEGPPGVRIALGTALGVGLPFAAITVFLATLAVRSQREASATGMSSLVGQTGVTRTPLGPEGKVYVRGEYWNARCAVPVAEGAQVRVTAVDGLLLTVEPI